MRTALVLCLLALPCAADGEQDNKPDNVRPIPPPSIAVPDADKAELAAGLDALGKDLDALRAELKGKPTLLALLPDVQIYHGAVRYALTYNEFFKANEVGIAKAHLKTAADRIKALREGAPGWTRSSLMTRSAPKPIWAGS